MLPRMNLVFVVALAMVLLTTAAWATPLSPLALSGYNADIVFGTSGDNGGYAVGFRPGCGGSASVACWFVTGATLGGEVRTGGLPEGDFVSSLDATRTYCLADAGGNDKCPCVLGFMGNSSGTLTLASPGIFDTIGVLATSCSGGGQYTATLNYSDSTTVSFAYNAWDWGQTTDHAADLAYGVQSIARANSSGQYTGFEEGSGNHRGLFETVVAADPTKTLVSVTFYGGGSNSVGTGVFAISGHEIPEPGMLALLATGLIGLFCYAWKKRK